jgi:nitrogen fixation protein NifB
LLSPQQAVAWVSELAERRPGEHFVVGVAGPGEPLANEETLETLGLVQARYPQLTRCISSNGLLLKEKLPELLRVGITALTVTVNAPDGDVGQQIYAWVRYRGATYRGQEGAELLIERQMAGIEAALASGLAVKVNTVLVPGVNDAHLVRLAGRLRDLGVRLMNVMPLIPGGQMADRRSPTCDELMRAREACAALVPQFHKCEQCSADVVRFPET